MPVGQVGLVVRVGLRSGRSGPDGAPGRSPGAAAVERAVYPARSTAAIRCTTGIAAGAVTRADAVAYFTVAPTSSSLFSFFSIRTAHAAQVIPSMDRPTC